MVQMPADAPRVEIRTSMGTFEVELYVKHAPRTCKNFLELARRGYYNGTIVSPVAPLISYMSSEGVHHHIGFKPLHSSL